jgi:hypothetical protein
MTSRRVRRFAALAVSSPSDAWLLARMLIWSYGLHALKHVVSFKTLLHIARPRGATSIDKVQSGRVESLLKYLSGSGDCLERSLVAYRFMLRAGARPTLFLGFEHAPPRRSGHAWVTVEGEPLLESADALERFAPVAVFES